MSIDFARETLKVHHDLRTLTDDAMVALLGDTGDPERKLPIYSVIQNALRRERDARQHHHGDRGTHEQIELILPIMDGNEIAEAFNAIAYDAVTFELGYRPFRGMTLPNLSREGCANAEAFLKAVLQTLIKMARALPREAA